MAIIIDALANHPDMVKPVACWCHKEWGHLSGSDVTLADYTEALREWIDDNSNPTMFVAVDRSIPVGSVALTERDPSSWIDVVPWLGALYVIPNYRGRNVAFLLVRYLIKQARDSQIRTLYAAVTDKRLRNLGLRHGWREIGQKLHKDRWVTIISLNLAPCHEIQGDAEL